MFKGIDIEIDDNYIYSNVDQLEVWNDFLNSNYNINEKFRSPFRSDSNPGCSLEMYDHILLFKDRGDPKNNNLTCIKYLTHIKGMNYNDALKYIDNNYIRTKSKIQRNLIAQNNKSIVKAHSNVKIVINPWKHKGSPTFRQLDVDYWGQWGITIEHLIEDNVYSLQSFITKTHRRTNKTSIKKDDYCYAYVLGVGEYKIYRPYENKINKWFTNSSNRLGSLDKLPDTGSHLIITKSYKDCRILMKFRL